MSSPNRPNVLQPGMEQPGKSTTRTAGSRLGFSVDVIAASLSESEAFADPPTNLFTQTEDGGSGTGESEAWTHT